MGEYRLEPRRRRIDERVVDVAVLDQQVPEPVQQHEVGLRSQRDVARRRHGRLGPARIDHHDGGVAVAGDPLPQDRMGDGQVRADQHDHVGPVEVGTEDGTDPQALALSGLLAGSSGLTRDAYAPVRIVWHPACWLGGLSG